MMETFTCSLCDKKTKATKHAYLVPLAEGPGATAVHVCKPCFTIVRSYETLKALEAGEYNNEGVAR